jgi:hypothetical protein
VRYVFGCVLVLASSQAFAQQWTVDGVPYPIFPQTSVRIEQGVVQAISPTLGPIYASRNETNGCALFQVGGNPPPSFLAGYFRLDGLYYRSFSLITIQPGEVFLGNSPMVNCRRQNGEPVLSTGAAVLRYGPGFDLILALATGGYTNFLKFYANANVYEATSVTGEVVCDGAIASPVLTPIFVSFSDGFEDPL